MSFVKFTETKKSFVPRVSINPRGLIGFNNGMMKRFELDNYKVCILYYDQDTGRIGFEFSNDINAEGAIKIRSRTMGADISAKSFLTFFNILPSATYSYPALSGDHPHWVIIDLTQGKERKSGSKEEV